MERKRNSKNASLTRFVFSHYARSALIPILTIELLLLVVYFAVNYYTNVQSEKMLHQEVISVMPHLVKKQASLINDQFETVSKACGYFAKSHEDLFANPESFRVIGENPHFAVAPTGALYQTNRTESSSLYYTHAEKLTAEQKEKARLTAALDPLYRHVVKDIPNVVASYFNTPDDMNRLYPFIPEVYTQYPPELNMEEFNFYYLADLKHNPAKKPVWTGVYLDPAGNGWMLSCVAPVYHRDTLAGVTGLDVTISDIVKNVLSQELPWGATAFLADQSGMILAMSPQAEEILGLKELKDHVYKKTIGTEQLKPEEYNLFKSRNPQITESFKSIYKSNKNVNQISSKANEDLFVVTQEIATTGWKIFVLVESKEVLKSVNAMARLSHQIGFVIILGMLVFYLLFFSFLRKRATIMAVTMAKPVADLVEASKTLGTDSSTHTLSFCGINELDELTSTFSQMSEQLEERSTQLVASQVQVQIHEKEAELAFAQGMYESASGYLHNVGNSITHLDSSIIDLESLVKSTEQYSTVFEKIAQGDTAILEKFRTILMDKSVPQLKETAGEIKRIKETIQQTIHHQQQSFKDAKQVLLPVKFDLSELIKEAVSTIKLPSEQFSIVMKLSDTVPLIHHRNQLYNGILNILKNGIESCMMHGKGVVTVSLKTEGEKAILVISDDGVGVLPQHRNLLMTAGFTTKPNGNGFGLHSIAVFLSGHNGKLTIESNGENQGAVVTLEVQNV